MLRNLYYSWCFVAITTCFITGSTAREAIVGGHKAANLQFPYQVSVQVDGQNICGGGIIGEEFVLTAAHCLSFRTEDDLKNSRLWVLVGTTNLLKRNYPAVTIEVAQAVKPSHYEPTDGNYTDNIAVLKLKEPLRLKHRTYLKKLQLPHYKAKIDPDTTAKIAGFGWNVINENPHLKVKFDGDNDNWLYFAEAKVLKRDQCQNMFLNRRQIHEKEFCAQVKQLGGDNSYGVCDGDVGSPLVDGKGTLIGILSSNPDSCSEEKIPGLYTYVSYYAHIIQKIMDEKRTVPKHSK